MQSRTLVLLRHAKADRPDGSVPDHDRPLAERGHRDAAAAGRWLSDQKLVPELVVCSPARRTRQTWHDAALELGAPPTVHYDKRVYEATAGDLLTVVQATDPEVGVLLLVGHNPGVEDLSALLDPDEVAAGGMRTAGIAVHAVSGAWTDLAPGAAERTAATTARG